ncbi:MAG: class I SAM-dependent methyltransferase [Bacteroidetes bacterium]|nr:class I SAM-dependent methyltransferase [Bacteroidota bacterium]
MGLFSKKKFDNPAKNLQGEFEVNNWITSEFILQKLVPAVGVHPFPLDELSLMTATVCRFRPELIFEWGTNIGKSARIFLEIVNAFDIPSHIHSIDLPDDVFHNEHPKNDRGKLVRGMKGVTLHQADGVTRALEIISQQKPKGKLLFLVDGDHSYDSVFKELTAILDQVPNAVVLLHDTFYQSPGSAYNIGPNEAIKAVLANRGGAYKTISTQLGLPGMTLVYN